MKTCPFCAEKIQDTAIKCPHCAEFLDGRRASPGMYYGYEYRSRRTLFGLPLLHIAQGMDPQTGRPRVAKGIVAVGNLAVGGIAVGGLALGGIAFGGLSLGLLALGGLAVGGVAAGGIALGIYLAVGGLAAAGVYAVGGLAFAPHAVSGLGADPELLRMLENRFPGLRQPR